MTLRATNVCSHQAGFTLLEMLVVIALMALVGAVALPALTRPSVSMRLQALTHDIVDALRLTRAAAIARNADLSLQIDVDKRTFESAVVPSRRFGPDVHVRLNVAAPERTTSSRGGIRFFPDGSSTGGEVVLSLDGQETKLCVNWLSGQARQAPNC